MTHYVLVAETGVFTARVLPLSAPCPVCGRADGIHDAKAHAPQPED